MQRSKCSEIIKKFLGPYFCSNLVEDIGVCNYGLLLDESNDITINKMLGIAIIYFWKKVTSTFLNLVQSIKSTLFPDQDVSKINDQSLS